MDSPIFSTGLSINVPVPDSLPGWVRIRRLITMVEWAFFFTHYHQVRAENLADELEVYILKFGKVVVYLEEEGVWITYTLTVDNPFLVVQPGQKHAGHIAEGCKEAAIEVWTRGRPPPVAQRTERQPSHLSRQRSAPRDSPQDR